MTSRLVFCISVLALLVHSPVVQQCPGGVSERSILGWMLQRHTYDTLVAELPHTCLFACYEDDRCQSFNWVISLLTCEFNNRTKEARPEDFIPNPDRFYFRRSLKRVPLGSIPELPAETCDEIKRSEDQAVSGKYWFSTIKTGVSVLAYCNMETNGCQPVGVADPSRIPNAQMTSSSYYSSSYYSYYGRLNETRGNGAWCPSTRKGPKTDYLQVDMGIIHFICAVATQGARNIDEHTESYILRMSIDGITWDTYKENNAEKVFQGNTDRNTIVKHSLLTAVKARFVRFYYVSYSSWPAIRVEIYA